MTLFGWRIELSFNSLQPWNHVRLHCHGGTYHFVWWRLSILADDVVSPIYRVCAQCDSALISEQCYGDEGWTVCQSCRSVEQGYRYVNLIDYERR